MMKYLKWMLFLAVIIGLMSCNPSALKPLDYGRGEAYEQVNYGGRMFGLTSGTSEPDLLHPEEWYFGNPSEKKGQSFTDIISSIRIGTGLKCEFYQDVNFKGGKLGPLGEGNYPDLRKDGWSDKIRSIKCYPAG